MGRTVTGTFTTTGAGSDIRGSKIAIHAEFAGTATVKVQWNVAGNWRDLPDFASKTTSFSYVYEGPQALLRLNCTAHTQDVTYELLAES